MRRKEVERRSKKYAAVQNVSVVGWYMNAEDFHQKYKTRALDKKRMSPSPVGKKRR
jgi:peptide methionine sulfoxide reductase MsrA